MAARSPNSKDQGDRALPPESTESLDSGASRVGSQAVPQSGQSETLGQTGALGRFPDEKVDRRVARDLRVGELGSGNLGKSAGAEVTSRVEMAKGLDQESAKAALASLHQDLNRLKRAIRMAIQTQLALIAGTSLESLSANKELVSEISELLDSHALRVRCNECGHPAILRVSKRPGCSTGVFVFDHTIDGKRTFHGGKSTLPVIRLVSKPPRKNARASDRSQKP